MIQKSLVHGDILDSDFRKLLPVNIYDLLLIISREGFSITLVGGAIRDWLLTGKLSSDLDFELRHTFFYDVKEWTYRVNRLGKRLREVYHLQVEFLSFSILRVYWPEENVAVELAPARLESYENEGPYGHSDFNVEFLSNGNYEKTFLRRDFTLNAMGVEFRSPKAEDEFIFIDPYNGYQHLREKVLFPCGPDFPKDPVRFCRAIRFKNKYKLNYSEKVMKNFPLFDLSKLTDFYFFREAFKGNFFIFTREFFNLVDKYQINLSCELKKIKFLGEVYNSKEILSKNAEQVLIVLTFHEQVSHNDLETLTKKLGVKESILKNIMSLKEMLKNFKLSYSKEALSKLLESPYVKDTSLTLEKRVENLLLDTTYNNLKKFHQLILKINPHSLDFLVETFNLVTKDESDYAEIQAQLLRVMPVNLLGKDLFKSLIGEFSGESRLRGELEYLAHFQKLQETFNEN